MTYEELEILIKNDEHRQLELKKTTGELKDGMHSATWTTDGHFVTVTFKRPDYHANGTKDGTKDDTKDNNPIKSDWSFVALAERLPKGSS